MSQKLTGVVIASSVFICGCSSTAHVQSSPSGAEVYRNGALIGTTPTAITDLNVLFSETTLSIRKDSYKDGIVTIQKDDFKIGPFIGGLFLGVPFLWMFGYPENPYAVKLEPENTSKNEPENQPNS